MLPRNHAPSDGVEDTARVKQVSAVGTQLPTSAKAFDSGTSTPPIASASGSPRSSIERPASRHVRSPTFVDSEAGIDEPKDTILNSFAPRVSVYASLDTEELIRLKGIFGGLSGLLRPFGENIPGKVIIRDSAGASKSWNDFGVQFVGFDSETKYRPNTYASRGDSQSANSTDDGDWSRFIRGSAAASDSDTSSSLFDEVLGYHMRSAESTLAGSKTGQRIPVEQKPSNGSDTPAYFTRFLRKLLSGRPMVPYETFTHPVACLIAISSQNQTPIETLRDLYNDTRQESKILPPWVGGEFLRYYLLVHDEDHDDIARSTALFNQMKRHFGVHCHLLRIRSTECSSDEKEGAQLPACQWLSAQEEISEIRQKEQYSETGDFQQYLFDSDSTVISTFVREMVTQSVIPFMEGRVTSWNDQVASRRRGISGRFMVLSKRWTGFGSGRATKTAFSGPGSTGSSYDPATGAYSADSSEAVMHRLADYAFMLRDWKLCTSIYDILRADFVDDKAWNHHAIANEMLAISLLLGSQSPSAGLKVELIDQMMDTATYSYVTRCANPNGAIRCVVIAVELYRSRGGTAIDEAAKWADRLLELSILSPLAQSILVERLAVCYRSQPGAGRTLWGSRNRKTAMWDYLGANMWKSLNKPLYASARLNEAGTLYGLIGQRSGLSSFPHIEAYWTETQRGIAEQATSSGLSLSFEKIPLDDNKLDEEVQTFNGSKRLGHNHRFSVGAQPQAEAAELLPKLHVPLSEEDDGFTYQRRDR